MFKNRGEDISEENFIGHSACPYANTETLKKNKHMIAYEVIPPRDSQEGYSVPESNFHMIAVRLEGQVDKGQYHIGDHKWRDIQYRKNTFHIAQAHQNGLGWQWQEKDLNEEVKKVIILLSQQKITKTAQEVYDIDGGKIEIPTQMTATDPLILQLTKTLQEEVIKKHDLCPMYKDLIMNILSLHIVKNYSVYKKTLKNTTMA